MYSGVFQVLGGANCGQDFLLRSLRLLCEEAFEPINVSSALINTSECVKDMKFPMKGRRKCYRFYWHKFGEVGYF